MVNRQSGRVRQARGAVLIPLVTLIVVLAVAFGTYRTGHLNRFICDGPCGAAYVEPPDALDLRVEPQAAAPDSVDLSPVDGAKVESAVRSSLTQSLLGRHVGFVALDPVSGTTLARTGSGAFTPASTTKVLTSYAVLKSIDAGTRFATRVVGPSPGSIILVGGGDPFLTTTEPKPAAYAFRANLTELAKRTATALKKSGATSVSLAYDSSLFSGPDASPHWESSYVAGNIVTPVSALWTDEGVSPDGIRARNPAAAAAETFATLLGKRGITIKGSVESTTAPSGAAGIARVTSAPLGQLLESLIQHSDNQAAEVMLRHVAVANGKPGTFDDGTAEVRRILNTNGIDTKGLAQYDGSGLSRDNLISPLTLAQTIRTAAGDPRTSSLVSDLPISGFNGSIAGRFQGPSAKVGLGVVRAKSGTLTGVHSLAGFVRDAEGRSIVFVILADRTGPASLPAAKGAIDNVAAALARCHCGS